jgi:hypothetical protein
VTANFFDVLRARPLYGRTFFEGEDTAGRERVAVIGYGLWQRRFGGDPALVGRTVRIEGRPFEIVGVMPKEFDYPVSAELWLPLALTDREKVGVRLARRHLYPRAQGDAIGSAGRPPARIAGRKTLQRKRLFLT